MKTLLTLILAGFLSAGAIEAVAIDHQDIPSQIATPDDPPSSYKIDLRGDLDYGVGPNSVEAYYGNNCVTVCFQSTLVSLKNITCNDANHYV